MGSKKKSSDKHYKNKQSVKAKTGESLKHLREGLGLSREYVAAELDTTVTSLYRWESGKSPVDIDTLAGLASVYQTEVPNLFKADDKQIAKARNLIQGDKK